MRVKADSDEREGKDEGEVTGEPIVSICTGFV